jgi:hypothetical protein
MVRLPYHSRDKIPTELDPSRYIVLSRWKTGTVRLDKQSLSTIISTITKCTAVSSIQPLEVDYGNQNSWHLHLRKLSIAAKNQRLSRETYLTKTTKSHQKQPGSNGIQFQFWRRRHRSNRRSRHPHPGRGIHRLTQHITTRTCSQRTPTRPARTILDTARQTMLQHGSNRFTDWKSSAATPPRTLRYSRATHVRSFL